MQDSGPSAAEYNRIVHETSRPGVAAVRPAVLKKRVHGPKQDCAYSTEPRDGVASLGDDRTGRERIDASPSETRP